MISTPRRFTRATGLAAILAVSVGSLASVQPGLAGAEMVDQSPPACTIDHDAGLAPPFAFVAQDMTPTDTGVFMIALSPGAVNLALSFEPFIPGADHVRFWLEPIDMRRRSEGGAVVADGAGNQCAVSVHFSGRGS